MARKLKFDILAFLQLHGIEYRTSGKNCAKGHAVVSCPFCEDEGDPDPSMHMGIELKSGNWGCWRSSHHRGKKLANLMAKLTGISYKEAAELVGDASASVDKEEFDSLAAWLRGIEDESGDPLEVKPPKTIPMPSSFRPITDSRFSQPYRTYLKKKRGFLSRDIDKVIETYDLRYCSQSGSWNKRLILPIYRDKKLGTYTGRSIDPNEELRYNSLGKEKSPVNIKETIYDFDGLLNTTGRALFVVEGPLDMLKMDFYGRPYNCRTTCLFSKTATPEQIADLYLVHKNFAFVIVLLDAGESKSASVLLDELSLIPNLRSMEIPFEGVDDPADLYPSEIAEMCAEI
ncbi:MAG: hypothetical protein GY833_21960 [Aestuariibacter sp.]|nr:hypothetical protein [Aestuariibacter sp.]|tara:strand:- start:77924 stop:78955 length:1032 start_codon:yes stop_codon:yes gene_type:complete